MSKQPRSATDRIADELRQLVGRLGPGGQLPSQSELVEQYSVSRDTIQRALKSLRDDGLIESIQGSGSFVRQIAADLEDVNGLGLEPAIIALDHYLYRAFQQPEVTIDFFGFTAETLASLLKPRRDRLRLGLPDVAAPRSLKVRLLLPDLKARLAVPRSIEDPSDPRPLERIRRKSQRFVENLTESIDAAALRRFVPETGIEVRTVEMSPQVKLYILNGTQALRGWYQVTPNRVSVSARSGGGSDELDIYDLIGVDVAMIPQEPSAVSEAQDWFDSLWDTIAEPYKSAE